MTPLSRREYLSRQGIGLGGLALAAMIADEQARAAPAADPLAPKPGHFPAAAKRVIFLFMHGGPSAVDTFDQKPDLDKADGKDAPKLPKLQFAVAEGRSASKLWKSPWRFTKRGGCGHPVSELFPHIGALVDDLCFLHSCHGSAPDHGAAVLRTNTGTESFIRPSLGSWVLYGLGSESRDLPGYVTITPSDKHGGVRNYGSAFLPAAYQGTALGTENTKPKDARFRFLGPAGDPAQRQQLDLLAELNRATDADAELDARARTFETAFRMQASAPDVLDLSREDKATRTLYGLDDPLTADFGAQCLLARRMSEAGVRVVQCSTGFKWDQHGGLVKGHAANAKATDKPVAGLITDLKRRGLLKDTLVIWGGEFGRTPTKEGGDGRDHNPHGYTMWLAGGGTKGGTRVGATDELGYFAADNKVHLHDLHATILHLLGLDHEKLTYRYAGRDFRLTDVEGRVVKEALA